MGNTLFPLLRSHPRLTVYAVDFSQTAVDIVRAHPAHAAGRVVAAVADLTSGELPAEVAACAADVATLMFVLSAISPEKMGRALSAVRGGLREGGLVLVRDYGEGDGAQLRFRRKAARQLDQASSFFVRQDGTRAYFFRTDELCSLCIEHPSVSRLHAALTLDAAGVVHASDLGSAQACSCSRACASRACVRRTSRASA